MSYTFISGATGGIGKAFATLCARKNYDLFLTGRSEEKLAALKSELEAVNGGIKILVRACQLTDEADRAALMAYADGQGVKFERAINVAGVDIQKAFSAYTAEKAQFQIRVNVEATVTSRTGSWSRGAPLKGNRYRFQHVGRYAHAVFRAVQRDQRLLSPPFSPLCGWK